MVIREENAGTWYHRGQVFCTAKKFDEAIACYNKALELSPNDPIIWRRKGFALLKAGRYTEADTSFGKALSIDPGNAKTWQRKAYTLLCLGKHKGAMNCCETALTLDPSYTLAWQNRGWLYGTICRKNRTAALKIDADRRSSAWHREDIQKRMDLEALISEIQEAEEQIEVPACIRETATEHDYDNVGLARAALREIVGRGR